MCIYQTPVLLPIEHLHSHKPCLWLPDWLYDSCTNVNRNVNQDSHYTDNVYMLTVELIWII